MQKHKPSLTVLLGALVVACLSGCSWNKSHVSDDPRGDGLVQEPQTWAGRVSLAH